MRIHWFANQIRNDISIDALKDLVTKLDTYGYYSVLFTYYNIFPDMFIKLAHVTNRSEKIKLMVAIRTKAISPEYLSMLAKGFSQIQEERLIFNILHGTLSAEETTEFIIDHKKLFSSKEQIFQHTTKFLNLLTKNTMFLDSSTGLAIPVSSNRASLSLAEKFADYLLTNLEDFRDGSIPSTNKSAVVVADVFFEHPQEDFDLEKYRYSTKNLLVVSPENFFSCLKELKEKGATDLMISPVNKPKYQDLLHSFIQKNMEAILAI